MQVKKPIILAIDTSCDETSVAITQKDVVLANVICSQVELHRPYGGVFPTIAKQAHRENLPAAIDLVMKKARLNFNQLSALAVTIGPGLAPALEIGIDLAFKLATLHHKPLIPVNHVEGHLWSALLKPNLSNKNKALNFNNHANNFNLTEITPLTNVMGIIVSGGHSEFVLVKKFGSYEIMGSTIDDAAGECLDKVGRILDLGYPAGPVIEKFAKLGNDLAYKFPLPMTVVNNYNLSFSGLKTAARNLILKLETQNSRQQQPITSQVIYDLCASFQHAVFLHISYKLKKLLLNLAASQQLPQAIFVGGGVAANVTLRKILRQLIEKTLKLNLPVLFPYQKKLCGDNAAMVGLVAFYRWQNQLLDKKPKKLDRIPRLSINEIY